MNILLLENVHDVAVEAFAERGHAARRLDRSLDDEALRREIAPVHALGIRSKTRLNSNVLAAAPDLMAVGCFCIGTNQVDLDAARHQGIVVFNAPFSNTRSVAELTIAEIIALHRRLGDKSAAMHQGRWDKDAASAFEVRGRTIGIVGYGHIGTQVSILAEALGLRVVYYDVVSKLPLGNARPLTSLDDLLATSDVISLHVPETPATRGMIGQRELAKIKRGSYLINNARGSVVDLDALAEALRAGRLGGAALDVYPQEPSNARDAFACPLAGLPNVILTPHIAGSTEEAQVSIARDVSAKLLRFIENGSTTSAVNVPEVELPQLRPHQRRILHFHRNVPGVLSKMHSLLADRSININAEYLQSEGDVSYVILDVDAFDDPAVESGLRSLPETIRVRLLW